LALLEYVFTLALVREQLERVGGKYFAKVKEATPGRNTQDPCAARRLWDVSVELTDAHERIPNKLWHEQALVVPLPIEAKHGSGLLAFVSPAVLWSTAGTCRT